MKILLLEDDPQLGPMLVRQLTRRGHTVYLATTISAARFSLQDLTSPDVVVTDQDLPDGNGWKWASDLPTRVVYMTGRPPDTHPVPFFTKGQDPIAKLFEMIETAP